MLSKLWKLSLGIIPHSPLLLTLIHVLLLAKGSIFLFLRKLSDRSIFVDLNAFSQKAWWDL